MGHNVALGSKLMLVRAAGSSLMGTRNSKSISRVAITRRTRTAIAVAVIAIFAARAALHNKWLGTTPYREAYNLFVLGFLFGNGPAAPVGVFEFGKNDLSKIIKITLQKMAKARVFKFVVKVAGPRNPEEPAWVEITVAKAKGRNNADIAMVAQQMGPIDLVGGSVESCNCCSSKSWANKNVVHSV